MPGHPSIPLTRVSGFGPLPAIFQDREGEAALHKIFAAEGVPIKILSTPDMPMPVSAMQRIFDRCARHSSDRLFGLTVGERMKHKGYGAYALYALNAPTLGEALGRLAGTSWVQHTGPAMEFTPVGRHMVLRYTPPKPDAVSAIHAEHTLPPMIDFIRAYLGRSWLPAWIETFDDRDGVAALLEDKLQVPAHGKRDIRGAGVAVPIAALSARLDPGVPRPKHVVSLRELVADTVMKNAGEPARTLSALVAMRLLDGKSDIEGAATLAGLSTQGLQRRLRQKGYTYREVLEEARQARAAQLLRETDMSIIEIALDLGYQDHASFTRAFKRRNNCAPSQFKAAVRRQSGPPFAAGDYAGAAE
ncbi:AraC family transcriptional regulator [Acuticoccus sp. M5D2P5]|uniref:helix-turn-helix domain-containing protein n=1 Tax=Acuticoccus kalidii TaxID=2910977 RepID=UPI001F38854A|nr:AraC family transcriptional regulator [Acuticoccus kalidii]MCF3934100.1 AraC family transcriptional regulator [Acuticoccus kalidii]